MSFKIEILFATQLGRRQAVRSSELKITGTLPEAGNLKPNVWWNLQAPAKKSRAAN